MSPSRSLAPTFRSSRPTQQVILELYDPHAGQIPIHRSRKRFNVVCFGRQSGKTTYGLNKVLSRAWTGPSDGIYWYILQTYSAAQVAFERMFQKVYLKCPTAFVGRPNRSELSCQLISGGKIFFKSGWNYEDLRVETLNGVVIDEYRQQPTGLWPLVIRPMLAAKSGWADILSTPNGYDHFYDLFEDARKNPEWGIFQAPSTIAPWWTAEEIASARRTMSEAEFAQEILAEFRDIHKGKVYTSFTHANQRTHVPWGTGLIDPYLPIIVGLDFNVGLMAWEIGQDRSGCWWWFDEIAVENTNTMQCAAELVSRYRTYGTKAPIWLCGDATGNSRHTSASESDYAILERILREAKIPFENRTPDSNPPVRDRVNVVNAKLRSADGTITAYVHPERCPRLTKDWQRVSWKLGATSILDQTTDPYLTHASDAAGYPMVRFSPEFFGKEVGKLRIIPR